MQTKICHLVTWPLFLYEFGGYMIFHIKKYRHNDGGDRGVFGGHIGGRRKRDLAI